MKTELCTTILYSWDKNHVDQYNSLNFSSINHFLLLDPAILTHDKIKTLLYINNWTIISNKIVIKKKQRWRNSKTSKADCKHAWILHFMSRKHYAWACCTHSLEIRTQCACVSLPFMWLIKNKLKFEISQQPTWKKLHK